VPWNAHYGTLPFDSFSNVYIRWLFAAGRVEQIAFPDLKLLTANG